MDLIKRKVDLRKKCFIKDSDSGRVYSFSPKELRCWDLYKSGKTKREAYITVFGKLDKRTDHIFEKKKFQLLKKMETEKSENLWERYKELSPEALDIQIGLMKNKMTKDELRNQIADKVQDRAGFSPTIKNATLRLNVNVDNPLAIKSSDELLQLFKDTTSSIKKLESELDKNERETTRVKKYIESKND